MVLSLLLTSTYTAFILPPSGALRDSDSSPSYVRRLFVYSTGISVILSLATIAVSSTLCVCLSHAPTEEDELDQLLRQQIIHIANHHLFTLSLLSFSVSILSGGALSYDAVDIYILIGVSVLVFGLVGVVASFLGSKQVPRLHRHLSNWK